VIERLRALVDRAVRALPAGVRAAPAKVFPPHGAFLLGEVAMFSFFVLVATGIYLALFYEASGEVIEYSGAYAPLAGVPVSGAYESVMEITFSRPGGAVVRQTHHWASLVFVAAIALHAARIFFTGAFRRPRRMNWMVGVTLLGTAMASGFFGLALPHDLLGATGARIGHAFAVSIPLIGPGVADLVFGGEFGNPDMLHRFWLLHVIVLPVVIGGLLATHLALVWVQTHTQFPGRRHREDNVVGARAVPGYALKTAGLFAVVAGVLLAMGALLQIAPIWLYGPFDPAAATVPAQPDWYLGWVEGALRILPPLDVELLGWEIPSPFFSGFLLSVVVMAVVFLWPLIEERATGDHDDHHLLDRPREHPVRTAVGAGGLGFLVVLLMAGSHDLQGLLMRVPVDTMTLVYRVLLLIVPPAVGGVTWAACRSLVEGERTGRGQPGAGTRHLEEPVRSGVG
jgi:ubiquinol-cytochrome c reductase cytochrome b subunit